MKITDITSSDKQEQIVYLGDDAIVHLDEVQVQGEDSITYAYKGVMIDNAKQYIEEALIAQAIKALKVQKLNQVQVTTTAGNTFDGNEVARSNMVSAIQASELLGLTETQWKLADNTVVAVGLAEIKEALALSIQAVGAIVLS